MEEETKMEGAAEGAEATTEGMDVAAEGSTEEAAEPKSDEAAE